MDIIYHLNVGFFQYLHEILKELVSINSDGVHTSTSSQNIAYVEAMEFYLWNVSTLTVALAPTRKG
jgi:hypothetical protein